MAGLQYTDDISWIFFGLKQPQWLWRYWICAAAERTQSRENPSKCSATKKAPFEQPEPRWCWLLFCTVYGAAATLVQATA